MRQMKFADDDLDVHAKIIFIAKNLDHAPTRVLGRRRPIDDFDIDYHVVQIAPFVSPRHFFADNPVLALTWPPGALALRVLHPVGDDDVLGDLLVHGPDIVLAVVVECPDDGGVSASEHAENAAFRPAIVAQGGDFDQHAVAVHGRADRRGRNEDIAREHSLQTRIQRLGVGNYKAIAVAVHGEAANHHVLAGCGLRGSVAVGINLDQLSASYQLAQALGEFPAILSVQSQFAHKLFEPGAMPGLAVDFLQNGGIAKTCQRPYLSHTCRGITGNDAHCGRR